MSNNVFPSAVRGLTYPVMKSAKFNTIVAASASGSEVRVAQMQNPLWTWTLEYEYLLDDPNNLVMSLSPYTDYQTMRGFILGRQGQFDSFLYTDPTDNTVTAQAVPLVNDGAGSPTYYSPVQRNVGGQFLEDITDLNPLNGSGLVVKANGVTKTGGGVDYTLHGPGLAIPGYAYGGMYIQWVSMPTAPITMSFSFYFRVRFADDSEDIEQFLYDVWTMGSTNGKNGKGYLTLTTARPANV